MTTARPVSTPATVQGLPSSRARSTASQAARPDTVWLKPFAGGAGAGAGAGGVAGNGRGAPSPPTSVLPPAVGPGGRGSGGGGGRIEMVKALFDYVAQVCTCNDVCLRQDIPNSRQFVWVGGRGRLGQFERGPFFWRGQNLPLAFA